MMRQQRSEARSQKSENTIKKSIQLLSTVVLVCILPSMICSLAAFGSEKWPGVDKAVVEKVANEHGREARSPLINTDQGDLLLFVFLIAGAISGFAAGYYWRALMVEKAPAFPEKNTTTTDVQGKSHACTD